MVQARIILLILGFCLPQLCSAGPWPRGEGNQFLSVSVETEFETGISEGDGPYGALYYERGLKNNLTLGFDGGSDPLGVSKAFGFLRWPAGKQDGASRLALEFGFGGFDSTFAIRPGLSWGRGFSYADMSGWMSVDTRLVVQETFEGVLESDVTLGLKRGARGMVIFQLQTGQPSDGEFYDKLAPSYVHEFRPGRRIEFGLINGISGTDEFKLKLGLWRDF